MNWNSLNYNKKFAYAKNMKQNRYDSKFYILWLKSFTVNISQYVLLVKIFVRRRLGHISYYLLLIMNGLQSISI